MTWLFFPKNIQIKKLEFLIIVRTRRARHLIFTPSCFSCDLFSGKSCHALFQSHSWICRGSNVDRSSKLPLVADAATTGILRRRLSTPLLPLPVSGRFSVQNIRGVRRWIACLGDEPTPTVAWSIRERNRSPTRLVWVHGSSSLWNVLIDWWCHWLGWSVIGLIIAVWISGIVVVVMPLLVVVGVTTVAVVEIVTIAALGWFLRWRIEMSATRNVRIGKTQLLPPVVFCAYSTIYA